MMITMTYNNPEVIYFRMRKSRFYFRGFMELNQMVSCGSNQTPQTPLSLIDIRSLRAFEGAALAQTDLTMADGWC